MDILLMVLSGYAFVISDNSGSYGITIANGSISDFSRGISSTTAMGYNNKLILNNMSFSNNNTYSIYISGGGSEDFDFSINTFNSPLYLTNVNIIDSIGSNYINSCGNFFQNIPTFTGDFSLSSDISSAASLDCYYLNNINGFNLNLNGYVIDGENTANYYAFEISDNAGDYYINISNGIISNWTRGILSTSAMGYSNNLLLNNLTFTNDNGYSIYVSGGNSENFDFSSNTFTSPIYLSYLNTLDSIGNNYINSCGNQMLSIPTITGIFSLSENVNDQTKDCFFLNDVNGFYFDLNGYTILGSNIYDAFEISDNAGNYNIDISNGTISNWSRGFYSNSAMGNINYLNLSTLTFSNDSGYSIYVSGGNSENFDFSDNTFNSPLYLYYLNTLDSIGNNYLNSCGNQMQSISTLTGVFGLSSDVYNPASVDCFFLNDINGFNFDLNGYSINGIGSSSDYAFEISDNSGNYNINISNGHISNWVRGISSTSAMGYNNDLFLNNISFSDDNGYSVYVSGGGSENLDFSDNTFASPLYLIYINTLDSIGNNYINSCGNTMQSIPTITGIFSLSENVSDFSRDCFFLNDINGFNFDLNGYSIHGSTTYDAFEISDNSGDYNVYVYNGTFSNWSRVFYSNSAMGNVNYLNLSTLSFSDDNGYSIYVSGGNSENFDFSSNTFTSPIYLSYLNTLDSIGNNYINSCGNTMQSIPTITGVFGLSSDVYNSASVDCFFLNDINGFNFDLNGYSINGIGSSSDYAFEISDNSGNYNINISNGHISNWVRGISSTSAMGYINYLNLSKLSFSNDNGYSVYISGGGSENLKLKRNNFTDLYLYYINNLDLYQNIFRSGTYSSNSISSIQYTSILNGSSVGNYWEDFSCTDFTLNHTVIYNQYNYTICDSNDYTTPFGGIDVEPLIKILENIQYYITLNPVSTPTGIINQNWTLINISTDSTIQNCRLNWNGSWIDSMIESSTYCYINQSGTYNNSYNYYVEVTGDNGALNTTSVYSVTFEESVSNNNGGGNTTVNTSSPAYKLGSVFPANGLISILITVILIFGSLFFN